MKATYLNTKLNDPVYGFIQINDPLIFKIINHRYFQRLRRIKQMGLSELVFPSATHTRFQHAIGTMHLMQKAVSSLREKDVDISSKEEQGLLIASLLHDIGHGPFSHSTEYFLFQHTSHEVISTKIVDLLNIEFDGKLSTALAIMNEKYHRPFMYQLVSSQIDVDRLDYLRRDSFFTGMAQANIDVYRIISMMNVHQEQLVFDVKGLHTMEKFLLDRRFMYLQVYYHKTNFVAESLLQKILTRSREIQVQNNFLDRNCSLYDFLLEESNLKEIPIELLNQYLRLDDSDILQSLKLWSHHVDRLLSMMCTNLLNRKLPSIELSQYPFAKTSIERELEKLKPWQQTSETSNYFVYSGEIGTLTYKTDDNQVKILDEDGTIHELTDLVKYLRYKDFSSYQYKYYLCYPKKINS